jgi:putative phage-type endonuclease
MSDTAEQGSEAWEKSRLGKVTASRMSDVIKRTKAGWSEYRRRYMIELLAERFTGMRADPYMSGPMLWGLETEPQARAAYEAHQGVKVEKVGFVDHPVIPMTGASPDGLVLEDGLVEIKCPETRTHVGYLIERAAPEQYVAQMQWQMACTERKWCDFVSFDPRMPRSLRLLVIRVVLVPEIILELEAMVATFLRELAETQVRILGGEHLASEDAARDLKPTNLFPRRK